MGHFNKTVSLEQIVFENVSIFVEGFDPILQSVDLEIPMDQTIIIESSNPMHAVHLLEVLAGRKLPQAGRIIWNESNLQEADEETLPRQEMIGCYFEQQRPHPDLTVHAILKQSGVLEDFLLSAVEHFEFESILTNQFRSLPYETQKLVLLIQATLRRPQMLTLEDPAVGLKEKSFLDYLDWIQLQQRQGHLRHIFMTNNHPAALRHLDANKLYVEDGLIYLEDKEKFKKAVHF